MSNELKMNECEGCGRRTADTFHDAWPRPDRCDHCPAVVIISKRMAWCPICGGGLETVFNLTSEGPDSHVMVRCVGPSPYCGAEWSLSTGAKE